MPKNAPTPEAAEQFRRAAQEWHDFAPATPDEEADEMCCLRHAHDEERRRAHAEAERERLEAAPGGEFERDYREKLQAAAKASFEKIAGPPTHATPPERDPLHELHIHIARLEASARGHDRDAQQYRQDATDLEALADLFAIKPTTSEELAAALRGLRRILDGELA